MILSCQRAGRNVAGAFFRKKMSERENAIVKRSLAC